MIILCAAFCISEGFTAELRQVALEPFPRTHRLLSGELCHGVRHHVGMPVAPRPQMPEHHVVEILAAVDARVLHHEVGEFVLRQIDVVQVAPDDVCEQCHDARHVERLRARADVLLPS